MAGVGLARHAAAARGETGMITMGEPHDLTASRGKVASAGEWWNQ